MPQMAGQEEMKGVCKSGEKGTFCGVTDVLKDDVLGGYRAGSNRNPRLTGKSMPSYSLPKISVGGRVWVD